VPGGFVLQPLEAVVKESSDGSWHATVVCFISARAWLVITKNATTTGCAADVRGLAHRSRSVVGAGAAARHATSPIGHPALCALGRWFPIGPPERRARSP